MSVGCRHTAGAIDSGTLERFGYASGGNKGVRLDWSVKNVRDPPDGGEAESDVTPLDRLSPVRVEAPVSRQLDRLTNTAVPKFDGTGCWQQHLQIFNAIVKSNGWVDETAALQLFAHLEGESLNVALLMSERELATREELSRGLSDYYGYPGGWQSSEGSLRV